MQIIVLGMHRSGTSAVTRLLNMMGAFVGLEDSLWGASEENLKGFWERRDVQQLNQRILDELGADWYRVSDFDLKRLSDESRTRFQNEARDIIMRLEPSRPWVIKDPRLCLTLPIWRKHLELPVCVSVYRNPLEVADSLRTRNGFPRPFSLALWEFYVVSSLRNSADVPRLLVSYNKLLANPVAEVEMLRAALEQHGVRELKMPTTKEIEAFLDPNLHRERESESNFGDLALVPQSRLYRALEDGSILDSEDFHGHSTGAQEMLELHERIVTFEKHAETLQAVLHERQQINDMLSQRVEELTEQNTALTERNTALTERNTALTERNTALTERNTALTRQIENTESRIEAFQTKERELDKSIKLEELRRKNDENRRLFMSLYGITGESRRDAFRLLGWIETLDKSLVTILSSQRWTFGELLVRRIGRRMLFRPPLSTEWITNHQQAARQLAFTWHNDRLPRYDELFKSIPDEAEFSDSNRYEHAEHASRLLDRYLPEIAASARTIVSELRELYKSVARLYRSGEILLDSRTWKVGNVLVNDVAKRVFRPQKRKLPWAPDKLIEIGSKLPGIELDLARREKTLRRLEPLPAFKKKIDAFHKSISRQYSAKRRARIKSSRTHTVVVPIFNAYDEVINCVESLMRYTNPHSTILLIDDSSTDDRILPLLKSYADSHPNIAVHQNEANLGFTATVNRGFQLSTGDVVILNSDTEVTPDWLDKLDEAAYSRDNVATVTPLTNTGSAFSIPRNNAVNELTSFLTPEMVNAAVEVFSLAKRPEAPTGNGFCMYIRREALDAVGHFDEDAFPRGYGEENDFCLRATAKGYVHLIDDTTFIYHKESASFLEHKKDLRKAGLKLINERYPGYDTRIQKWLQNDELSELRDQLEAIWSGVQPLPVESALVSDRRSTLLSLVHEGTGGTIHHLNDVTSAIGKDHRCLRLESASREWCLSVYTGNNFEPVKSFRFSRAWDLASELDAERTEALDEILADYQPDLVHIHHLLGSAPEIIDRSKAAGARVIYSFHDFYAVCPSFHLLDHNSVFCGGRCTPGDGECRVDIAWADYPPLKHSYVHEWRRRVEKSLDRCDRLISFSESARQIVLDHFPELDTENYVLIPHGQDLGAIPKVAEPPAEPPIRVLLLGSLATSKGIDLINEIMRMNKLRRGPFEFHFVGKVHPRFDPARYRGVLHGSYRREDLAQILERIRPSFAIIASIWCETFCYTLSECWAAGLPVFTSDLGTQKERVEAVGGGWVVDPGDPEAWYNTMLAVANDPDQYAKVSERIRQIKQKTLEEMRTDYHALYSSLHQNGTPSESQVAEPLLVPVS